MKRRIIAAAIFIGILLLLLWISQPRAHANTRKAAHPKQKAQPCITVVLRDSPAASETSAKPMPEGEEEWDPVWDGGGGDFSDLEPIWNAAVDCGYIGSLIGVFILL